MDTPTTDAKASRIRMQTVAPAETALDWAREMEAALREIARIIDGNGDRLMQIKTVIDEVLK